MALWRNLGIRAGLKIQWPKGLEGSTPSRATKREHGGIGIRTTLRALWSKDLLSSNLSVPTTYQKGEYMTDHLKEWNKEVNYSTSKKKKPHWKDKMYRVAWESGLRLESLRVLHSTRKTLESARNFVKHQRKYIWKDRNFWIETKESGKWEKFEN